MIRDKSFTNERLNTFKKSLEHKFDYVKIDYDNNFLSEVDAFIKEEENFEENSLIASQIWENEYDVNDFQNFTGVLEKKMKKRDVSSSDSSIISYCFYKCCNFLFRF